MASGKECRTERVNITLTSEIWNHNLDNRESNEFKALENNILSAVSCDECRIFVLSCNTGLHPFIYSYLSAELKNVPLTIYLCKTNPA